MTIKNIIEFYFAQYEVIDVKLEMFGGLPGKYQTFTKEEYYEHYEGWNEDEAIKVFFSTYCVNFASKEAKKLDRPQLNIIYK